MTQITVLDSIMGSGKSTYVIKMLNDICLQDTGLSFIDETFQPRRFIIVVPLLYEVDRFIKECPELHFKDPQAIDGKKLNHLETLIEAGENIVTTHSLFTKITRDIYDKLKEQSYTLVIDEALDCVDIFTDLTKADRDLLFSSGFVHVDDASKRLCWNQKEHAGYTGKFSQIKALCEAGALVSMDKLLLWEFPHEFLRCFHEVLVCTYLFEGSTFCAYLRSHGFDFVMKAVRNCELVDWNEGSHEQCVKGKLRPLIKIYEGSMNSIGQEVSKTKPLSSTWFKQTSNSDRIKCLKSSVISFFERHAETHSRLNGWTTFNKQKSKLKGKGYTRGWIPCNAKGTNVFADVASMAYLCNWFYHPTIKRYFIAKDIAVDEDAFALSAMIQWIWRSRIRKVEPISLFIPSERMRKLFKAWINGEHRPQQVNA